MKERILVFFFSLLVSLPALAIRIEGKNREYAEKEIEFYRFSDPVTQEKELVFTLKPDEEGNFTADTEVPQTTFVFSDFGIYRGLLFLEPGKNLKLLFPPLREKSFADSKNPYFEPVEFWFSTEKGDQLNDHISIFDSKLNLLTDKFFNQLYFTQSQSAFDSVKTQLSEVADISASPVFTTHKNLKLKSLEADVFRLKPETVSKELMKTEQEFLSHPAFLELFDKTFANKLSFEARAAGGDKIRQAVAARNVTFLKNLVNEKYNIPGSFADLVLLKILHDAFYSGDFQQNDILAIISSPALSADSNQYIRHISENILKKLKFLQKGSKAPVICLKDTNGHNVCSDSTPADDKKFKYLIFADTEMIVCREHLKYLTRIDEMFQKQLEIIIVLRKSDIIGMKIFLDKEKIPGIHLVDENSEFAEKYRVKSYPSCLLLNHIHEVEFQQAFAPMDGFEQQFGSFLQQHLFEQQRNQER